MPQRRAAKRYLRKSLKNRSHNLTVNSELKKTIKTFRKAVAAGEKPKAQETLKLVYKKLDKAAKTGLIHSNNAARQKSRLTLTLNKIKAAK